MRSYFDWLSDDIVIDIIGRLNWKDAVKTSAVSHRFCHVFGHVYNERLLVGKNLNLEDETNVKFVDFINQALRKHKGSKVDSLRIALVGHYNIYSNELVEDDYERFSGNIVVTPDLIRRTKHEIFAKAKDDFDGWVRFAKAKCVQNLEISRHHLNSGGKVASLYPAFPMLGAWDKLTALTLKSVVPADLYAGLKRGGLNNLESLVLEDAFPSRAVIITCPALKRLEIRDGSLRNIFVDSAPNLECFKYVPLLGNKPADYCIVFVPLRLGRGPFNKLSHVCYSGGFLDGHGLLELQKAGMLEELELVVDDNTLYRFPELPLIRHLKLNFPVINERCIPLLVIPALLAAYPKLHKLTLDYHKWDEDQGFSDLMRISASSHTHDCLKEVEFIGWCGDKDEDHVVNFLKEIAPNLEKALFKNAAN